MLKVYQKSKYDCLRACLASLIEQDLEAVPNFNIESSWESELDSYLEQQGYQPLYLYNNNFKGIGITILKVKGGEHAVLSNAIEVVHDPQGGKLNNVKLNNVNRFEVQYTILLNKIIQ